ncbi:MAG: nucleotidyl transferase AbiEii/AbiGii toxin family protein [Spirochaetes bacterium]|nr:nucleotidyl transferase AbiEii/AbiGii toxin family protein [Spirochaetota bacterium]
MIDDIREYLKEIPENQKLNFLREYLQLVILKIISDSGYKNSITFTGGTALRIVFRTNRFSEDMDFSLTSKKDYNFKNLLTFLEKGLNKYGFSYELARVKEEIVNSLFIRFPDFLKALHLTQQDKKLSVKLEIDTNPPAGGKTQEYIYYDRFYFVMNHFTLESLFALKLHAILFRKYTKGRDFYDLMFFLNKKVIPQFDLFKRAARQTHPDRKFSDLKDVFVHVKKTIKDSDEKKIVQDLQPFLLKPDEMTLVSKKNLLLFLDQYLRAL